MEILPSVKYAGRRFILPCPILTIIILGKVSITKNIKSYGIFRPNFSPPPPHPPSMEKKHFFSTIFFYVFIMFIITKFGEKNLYLILLKCLEPKS